MFSCTTLQPQLKTPHHPQKKQFLVRKVWTPPLCGLEKNGAPSEATAVIESQGSASERPASSWQKKMNPGTKLTFSDLGLVKWLATGGKNWLNNGFSPSCQLVS